MSLAENKEVFDKIGKSKIVAVLVIDEKEVAVEVAHALLEGGINAIELALRTPCAIDALKEINADALAIHINPAQEVAQNGGNRDWRGIQKAIKKVKSGLDVPVIVKEVGNGISGGVAKQLAGAYEEVREYYRQLKRLRRRDAWQRALCLKS